LVNVVPTITMGTAVLSSFTIPSSFPNFSTSLKGTWAINSDLYFVESPNMELDKDKLTISVICANNHTTSVKWSDYNKPCGVCKAEVQEFFVESVTFRNK